MAPTSVESDEDVGTVLVGDTVAIPWAGTDGTVTWNGGTFAWNIPQQYMVPDGTWKTFVMKQEEFVLGPDGTMTASKGDAAPVTYAPGD
jgi:hypothetical protein